MLKKRVVLMLLVFILTSCAPKLAEIQVKDAWARAARMDDGSAPMKTPHMGNDGATMQPSGSHSSQATSAIYMVINNQTSETDRLIAAECNAAKSVEIHETRMDNDIMMMRQVENIEIPAGQTIELKPGGYHIMLIGLTRDLTTGEKVPFTLVFEKAGRLQYEAEIRTP